MKLKSILYTLKPYKHWKPKPPAVGAEAEEQETRGGKKPGGSVLGFGGSSRVHGGSSRFCRARFRV